MKQSQSHTSESEKRKGGNGSGPSPRFLPSALPTDEHLGEI